MTNDPGSAAAPPPSRLAARRRAELLAHCRSGQVAHAVDLAFEHLAAHGPDPALVCELCSAGGATDLDPRVRRRLHELVRNHHPDLRDETDPCAVLAIRHASTPAGGADATNDPGSAAPR